MESESDALDTLLTEVLEQYTPAPRPGLEQRVMVAIRARQRRRWIFAFAAATPALLTLVVALFFVMRPVPSLELVVTTPPPRLEPQGIVKPPVHMAVRRTARPHATRPFPTPSPLTAEEKALQELVAARPREAQQLLVHEPLKPIEIEEIQIAPLQSDGGR